MYSVVNTRLMLTAGTMEGVRCYRNVLIKLIGLLLLFFENVAGRADGDVRLRDGPNIYSGRVEIYYRGHWGTVCDDDWNINDALVTCRQLGYQSAIQAYSNAHFGKGSGAIILDEVQCSGYETRLENCQNLGWLVHDCGHHEDAGVECSYYGFRTTTPYLWQNNLLRLVGGSARYEGRVEVYYDGKWNTVCDDSWDSEDATVVCRQLGYEGPAEAFSDAYFGAGEGDILLDHVSCFGWESTLLQCPSNNLYEHDCTHEDDAGVRCERVAEGIVRLSNGYTESSGRVEIYFEGEWGTICDDHWSFNDAIVICRQLGYDFADDYYSDAYFGRGSGPIMFNLGCNGNEWSWQHCSYQMWKTRSCSHYEDASVSCFGIGNFYNDGSIRLVDGYNNHSGRVEIYYSGEWGTVCDDGWTMNEANVVCKQLGYPSAFGYESNAYFGPGSGQIMLDDVSCNGNENSLIECDNRDWYNHNCNHSDDVSVICQIQDTSTSSSSGSIAAIVIGCVFVFVCICVGLVVVHQQPKQNRADTQTRIAVISGLTNLAVPSSSQFNYRNMTHM